MNLLKRFLTKNKQVILEASEIESILETIQNMEDTIRILGRVASSIPNLDKVIENIKLEFGIPNQRPLYTPDKYIVKVTYFKRSGKYYTHCEYETEEVSLLSIWSEVIRMKENGTLPGLSSGGVDSEFIISVDVPDHPNNHPKLIV
jgi:hypothetical protein